MICAKIIKTEINDPPLGDYHTIRIAVNNSGFNGYTRVMVSTHAWREIIARMNDYLKDISKPFEFSIGEASGNEFTVKILPYKVTGERMMTCSLRYASFSSIYPNSIPSHEMKLSFGIEPAQLDEMLRRMRLLIGSSNDETILLDDGVRFDNSEIIN